MYHVLTCDGYHVEAVESTMRLAVARCRSLERESGDGYGRVVSHDGRLVADSEGPFSDPEHYVDAATQTGMYDED